MAPRSQNWVASGVFLGLAIASVPLTTSAAIRAGQDDLNSCDSMWGFATLLFGGAVCFALLVISAISLGSALSHQALLNQQHPDRRPRAAGNPWAALPVLIVFCFAFLSLFSFCIRLMA